MSHLLYHLPVGEKEVLQVELPGEDWLALFDPAFNRELHSTMPRLTNCVALPEPQPGQSPVISVSIFQQFFSGNPGNVFCQTLMPYVSQAVQCGYDYLVFVA